MDHPSRKFPEFVSRDRTFNLAMKPARSPIEQMVDQACGFDPEKYDDSEQTILLECPVCKQTKKTHRTAADPKSAVKLVLYCPKCLPKNKKTVEGVYRFDQKA